MMHALHIVCRLFIPSFLRSDALAHILTLSNVHAYCNMLVMETTQGLISGAMLERMGGESCYL